MSRTIEITVKSFAEETPVEGHLILFCGKRESEYGTTYSIFEIGNFQLTEGIDPKIKNMRGLFVPYFEADPLPIRGSDYWVYLKDLRGFI